MKKLAKWMAMHLPVIGDGGKDTIAYIITMLVTFGLVILWFICKWNWQYLWQGLAGFVTFVPPLFAGVVALIKKEKWNPWMWFPCIVGVVHAGLIAAAIVFIIRLF